MSYRALFVADIHIGNSLPWSVKDPNTLISDRATDIMDVLVQMFNYAQENQIIDIWILGDLIDKRLIDAVTLKLVTDALIRMQQDGQRILMVPGNHEAGDAVGRHYTLDAFASMGFWVAGVSDVSKRSTPMSGFPNQISLIEPVDGFEVMAMPFVPAARALELMECGPQHMPAVMMLHQTLKGGMVGGWTSPEGLDPAHLESIAPTILSGHFHDPQSITANTHYLGAPVQHTFADAGQRRGFWDISWNNGTVQREMIPIAGAPTFHEYQWITSGAGANELPPTDNIPAKSYVNLKVVGPEAAVKKLWINAEDWAKEVRARDVRLVRLKSITNAEPTRQRIVVGDGAERPTWDKVLSSYLDATDCTGLDRQTLEALGKELMADAER